MFGRMPSAAVGARDVDRQRFGNYRRGSLQRWLLFFKIYLSWVDASLTSLWPRKCLKVKKVSSFITYHPKDGAQGDHVCPMCFLFSCTYCKCAWKWNSGNIFNDNIHDTCWLSLCLKKETYNQSSQIQIHFTKQFPSCNSGSFIKQTWLSTSSVICLNVQTPKGT